MKLANYLIALTAVLATALLASIGCNTNTEPPSVELETILASVNEDNPGADAVTAFDTEGERFAGCYNQAGLVFPGIPPSDWPSIRETKAYWVLTGTTDAFESSHHLRLQERAWKYAEQYNTEMLNLSHPD
ncbi:MAG: hypothetical protein KDA90_22860 [Planctomycetaceae bacterium]|nr:hypothetical protein [Planctomycetaceae bacterium]